jgi:hypothetical protein
LVVNPVRLPNLMYYSGRISTYSLDRTTVAVGAPRILAISTNPTSAGASSWASVAAASSATAATDAVLPSATGGWRDNYAKSSSTVGLGCGWLQLVLPLYPNHLRHPALRGRKAESPASKEFRRQYTTSRHKYSTTLFKEAYLLGCGLRDLKFLGHALAGHVARLLRRRRQTSLLASGRILNERDLRQARAAEP